MNRNTYLAYMVFAGVLLITSNCMTSSNVKNESNANNSSSVNKPSPSPTVISSIASQKDGTNDVVDGDDRQPPTKLNGMDLISLQLEMAGSDLKVTFEANDPIPTSIPAGKSALWQVEAWSKDKTQGYYLGVKLVESKWYAFVFNLKTAVNVYVENSSVSGNKLVASFPIKQLPNLTPSFIWSATTEYDGKWRDEIPDEGMVSFPAS